MAIHESLHFGIEILYADRNAGETQLPKRDQLFAGRVAGMNFH